MIGGLAFTSCKKDDTETETDVEVDAATQNAYDDEAITKFLNDNYLDTKGNVKAFSDTDTSDDNYKKLSELSPIKLPSGVVYIIRDEAQPDPGKVITGTDSLKIMMNAITYKATKVDDVVALRSASSFKNTISGTGIPEVDPAYFYVRQKAVLDKATTDAAKQRSYYEIEGLKEALLKFKSFEIPDANDYNLQGVIIVPSRAAFAKDAHYNYTGLSFKDRSFVFNFQLYNAYTRVEP